MPGKTSSVTRFPVGGQCRLRSRGNRLEPIRQHLLLLRSVRLANQQLVRSDRVIEFITKINEDIVQLLFLQESCGFFDGRPNIFVGIEFLVLSRCQDADHDHHGRACRLLAQTTPHDAPFPATGFHGRVKTVEPRIAIWMGPR